MHPPIHLFTRHQVNRELPRPPQAVFIHRHQRSASTMSATGDSEYEHWPSDKKYYTQPAKPAPGFDGNNGYHSHSYLMPKEKSRSPARADSKSPQPPVVSYPQPIYYGYPTPQMAHPGAQQYYSHPVPIYNAPQGYYQPYPMPAPVGSPMPGAPGGHYYIPVGEAPKAAEPGPTANAWIGRTKAQVDEDNMKMAKSEKVYEPREFVPKMDDSQMCWVVELDKTNTLRMFREAKELTGYWKEDPRYPKSFYFIRTEEKED
ncbi:hypothetical protein CKM354_000920400 [Cercospora kikuchii]|uniref:Uncharacterized protein n=1 Tax=Cercospora kikuchii TaxID=84275 RepID=A0A9P3FK69_9PEZI|nr:uncharacterized protein CKM354_000920400 [Cercospora kikuchii]GIZ46065.1 hypothetical protein CKM354_000920400 [Cercospora kikuchii]